MQRRGEASKQFEDFVNFRGGFDPISPPRQYIQQSATPSGFTHIARIARSIRR